MPQVHLTIVTGRIYAQLKPYTITMLRMRDASVRRVPVKSDIDGRLTLRLDGDDYEIGITGATPEPVLTLAGYRIEDTDWATAGKALKVMVRFANKGTAASKATVLRWETSNRVVQIDTPAATLRPLAPAQSFEVPLALTVKDETREVVKLFAMDPSLRLPLEIPLFPPAPVAADFVLADGKALTVFEHATQKTMMPVGDGNGDGRANAGERIAIGLPDSGAFRLAELFTSDRCVDNSTRISDVWSAYDHVGASVKYSLPLIRSTCPPGHMVRFMARVQIPHAPNHEVRYAVVQFAVSAPTRSPTRKSSSPAPEPRPGVRPR